MVATHAFLPPLAQTNTKWCLRAPFWIIKWKRVALKDFITSWPLTNKSSFFPLQLAVAFIPFFFVSCGFLTEPEWWSSRTPIHLRSIHLRFPPSEQCSTLQPPTPCRGTSMCLKERTGNSQRQNIAHLWTKNSQHKDNVCLHCFYIAGY